MKSLGICVGASNIGAVLVKKEGNKSEILWEKYESHDGNPQEALLKIKESGKWQEADSVVLTGRKYKDVVNLTSIPESEALEAAFSFNKDKYKDVNFIVSAGAETIIAYRVSPEGRIIDVATGNKCASGTGEFFLQQLGRMNIGVEEAITSAKGEEPYKVAGRCSVFCKSDCTHALNKGTPKKNVVAGLCDMMAGKIVEILRKTDSKNILIVGGLSKNDVMVDFVGKKSEAVYVDTHSHVFEALGAALWGTENKTISKDIKDIFKEQCSSFPFLPSLEKFKHLVRFEELAGSKAEDGDECILGLDVGSTTTKAVLLRKRDNAMLADCYLRTNGDPIGASRNCYTEIAKQVDKKISITGLGVTGSGRQIAGLHAMTPSVINEIIAHAKAASHFDKDVDTIFEIGGQDAKYTYIVNGVPADYAMNEACSAGTGSFLEEAAREVLGIDTLEIEKMALKGERAPNFNDQCSAFISSDIKVAIQEGVKPEEITAGLVYSICMNYVNRVKGNRPYGGKIFMQGGVCYNKAVPIAMASLIGKEIVVPPNPGLMGAFGVALAVKEKLELGLVESMNFNLKELSSREVGYKDSFVCAGGKEKCDRKCNINRVVVNDKIYPFGGACNKYYNMAREKQEIDTAAFDLVRYREHLVFEKYGKEYAKEGKNKGVTIGINNSLLTNTLFPLYYNFFKAIGCNVVYSDKIVQAGIEKKSASFCYPIEVAHGAMEDLIQKNPDYFFIPHITGLPVKNDGKASVICPFVQSESYCLSSAFEKKIMNPVFDFSKGYIKEIDKFIEIGVNLGAGKKEAEEAYKYAVEAQRGFHKECRETGKKFVEEIEKSGEIGIVLFGRPYNAFTKNANMGIPAKFASRGYRIIPADFMAFQEEEIDGNIYWAMGRIIMKTTKIVKKNPNLFGAYITNFSCGPDSFLTTFFRDKMGDKPSLILELDSHTADAGVDTRVEAFLDVISSYIELKKSGKRGVEKKNNGSFQKAETFMKKDKVFVRTSDGKEYPLTHKRVKVVIPPMNDMGSIMLAASMRYCGINAMGISKIGEEELKLGRGMTSCKECLPLTLVVGSLAKYIEKERKEDEITVYFMPEASGPCRFGLYNMFINNMIEKEQIRDVATLSLTCENGYAGFSNKFTIRAWQFIIIEDVLQEIYSAVLVMAKDKEKGLKLFEKTCEEITDSIARDSWKDLKQVLKKSVKELEKLETVMKIEDVPKVGINGEIYVRKNSFSRQNIVERLADKGIIAKVAPTSEWLYFCDYLVKKGLVVDPNFRDKLSVIIMQFFKNRYEREIKKIFAPSKFYEMHMVNVEEIMENVEDLVSPVMAGEQVLTVGASITELIDNVDGVVSIGPFGCMPSRIAEAVLNDKMNERKRETATDKELVERVMKHYPYLPFLAIETDGNPFSQVIEAKFENFCIQVGRVKKKIMEEKENMEKSV